MITLQPGEKILMEVHKHWLGIVTHAVALFGMTIALLAIIPFVQLYLFEMILLHELLVVGALWVWFVWMMFFVMWTNYYLDVIIITNQRFIDMEQLVLFSRDEVIVPLEQIEDIKIEVNGVLATLLRFGNLQIQTAGATKETIVKGIMYPDQLRACLEGAVSNRSKSDTIKA
ncbi:MAG: PH domain-containing protein [bacterium]|nr:PH domain-containing protein [bacterium]